MGLTRVGYARRAHGSVRDRMLADKISAVIAGRLAVATHEELNSDEFEDLRVVFALCASQHLPQTQAQPHLSAEFREPFNVDRWGDTEFENVFYFQKGEFNELVNELWQHLADPLDDDASDEERNREGAKRTIKTKNRTVFTVEEAFATTLCRLHLGWSIKLVAREMTRQMGAVSDIVNIVAERLFPLCRKLFGDLLHLQHQPERVEKLKQAVARKCGHLDKGYTHFIDGTTQQVCRPTRGQQSVYSGNHRVHGVCYVASRAGDGICDNLCLAMAGRHHDAFAINPNQLVQQLEEVSATLGTQVAVYGDSAFYGFGPHIGHAYKDCAATTPDQAQETLDMYSGRIIIEWQFGEQDGAWAILRNKHAKKILNSPVELHFNLCVLLTNCATCLRGNNTSAYFDLDPPLLDDYLNNNIK